MENEENKNVSTSKEVFTKEDIEKTKSIAMWAYVLFFLPLVVDSCKDSKFARFHANQGLLLLIANVAGNIVVSILGGFLGFLSSILSFGWWAVIMVFMVKSIMSANKGEANELPKIGKYRIIK